MIEQLAWLDRNFAFDQQVGVFPVLLERLRGTVPRAKELALNYPEEMLEERVANKWSVKEHIGHLIDLERLDIQRLHEFLGRVPYWRRQIWRTAAPRMGVIDVSRLQISSQIWQVDEPHS